MRLAEFFNRYVEMVKENTSVYFVKKVDEMTSIYD